MMTPPDGCARTHRARAAASALHDVAGATDQAARVALPARSLSRCTSAPPLSYAAHRPAADGSAAATHAVGSTVTASARAWRGGTAARTTSLNVPAYLSATSPTSRSVASVSTGSMPMTRSSGLRAPAWSPTSVRPTTKASVRRPAKRTRTRLPTTAPTASSSGTA